MHCGDTQDIVGDTPAPEPVATTSDYRKMHRLLGEKVKELSDALEVGGYLYYYCYYSY